MKKIFAILFALVLVVSLGLVTAPPAEAAVIQPTVTVSPARTGQVAQYTVVFGITSSLSVGESITVEFPANTAVPGSYDNGDITINAHNVSNGDITVVGRNVMMVTANGIGAPATVTLIFTTGANITNPTTTGDYKLKVNTSKETTRVESVAYAIRDLPAVTAVSPSKGNVGSTMWVVITGTSFMGDENTNLSDTTISFGAGADVLQTKYISVTEINVQIEVVNEGTFTVRAETPAGKSTTNGSFTAHFDVAYELTITADPVAGGDAIDVGGKGAYAAGAEVSIKAVANTGYGFVGWTATAGDFDDETVDETTFIMPAQAVTVIARFAEVSPPPAVPKVTTLAATDISSHLGSVHMSYTLGNFGSVEVRFACKRLTDPAWFYSIWVPRTADGNYTEVLTGLISQTEYEFKAQLKYNSTVIEGTPRQFTTERPTYNLTISSMEGGSVTTPGEGTFTYDEGTVVNLVATPASGHRFVNWDGDVGSIANVSAATTTITMQGDYKISARFMAGVVAAKTETVTNSTVDARAQADTKVVVKGTATVTVFQYPDNPGGPPPPTSPGQPDWKSLGKYIDFSSNDTTEVTETEIQLYYTDTQVTVAGIEEESLRLFWWNDTAWVQCSYSGVDTGNTNGYSGYMWAVITEDTTPSLDDLQGTPWGGYGHPTEKGICFVATAAYGTDTAKEIDILREFRDEVLLPNSLGAKFVSFYYEISPPIAGFISQDEVLRTVVKVGFVDSIVAILNWSHDLWSVRRL